MLYGFVLTIHLIVCFVLIAVVLLQAGRGGGFADATGGAAQALGTRGATMLTRATAVCAVIFMVTSLTLAVLSAQRGRSLMEGAGRVQAPIETPAAPVAPPEPGTPAAEAETPKTEATQGPAALPPAEQPAAEQPAEQP